jgi:hypothetical protein
VELEDNMDVTRLNSVGEKGMVKRDKYLQSHRQFTGEVRGQTRGEGASTQGRHRILAREGTP